MLTLFFLTIRALQDIVALVIQSIGGGIASTTQPTLGGHIALGGIALQLGSVSHSFCPDGSGDH